MEKIKERNKKYEVSVTLKNNGYYIARYSLKLGGEKTYRIEKSGTNENQALNNLLDEIINYIDTKFKNGFITCKIDNRIPDRLIKSINNLGIITPEITEKALLIVNQINYINSSILNTITLQQNFIQINQPQTNSINTFFAQPTQPCYMPTFNNALSLVNSNTTHKNQPVIIKDLVREWLNYRFSLCKKK